MKRMSKSKHNSRATAQGKAASANHKIRELVDEELGRVAGGDGPVHCFDPICVGRSCGVCTCHCFP